MLTSQIELSSHRNPEGFSGGSAVKNHPANARDTGSIPGSGRSPGEGNGNPLQLLLPGKSHGQRSLGFQKSWTQLSDQIATTAKKSRIIPSIEVCV